MLGLDKKQLSLLLAKNSLSNKSLQTKSVIIIISKYLIKELISRIILILVSLYIILLVSQIIRISSIISSFGFSLSNFVQPLFYISVMYLSTLIPVAFFLGTLITILKLNETDELTAIIASGRSLLNFSKPFLFVSIGFFLICLICSNYFESWGKEKLLSFIEKKALGKIESILQQKMQEKVFTEIFKDYYLYAEEISSDKSKYKNVVLAPKHNSKLYNSYFIIAQEGETVGSAKEKDLIFKFHYGTLYQLSSTQDNGISAMSFASFEIDFFTGIKSQLTSKAKYDDHRSLNSIEIYHALKSKTLAPESKRYKRLHYLLYARIFSPLLIICFAFWGIFLGIHNLRRAKNPTFLYFFSVLLATNIISRSIQWLCEEGLTNPLLIVPISYFLLLQGSYLILFQKNKQALWEPFKLMYRKN